MNDYSAPRSISPSSAPGTPSSSTCFGRVYLPAPAWRAPDPSCCTLLRLSRRPGTPVARRECVAITPSSLHAPCARARGTAQRPLQPACCTNVGTHNSNFDSGFPLAYTAIRTGTRPPSSLWHRPLARGDPASMRTSHSGPETRFPRKCPPWA